jgi:MFS family permease
MVVIGSGLLMSINVLMFLAAGLLLPPLAETLGVGLGQAMVFVSISMLSGAALLMVAGPFLLRRLGPQRLALVGGVFTGVALFAVAFIGELWQLYVLAFASGLLATASLQMTGAALVNAWFIAHRGLMQGVLMGVAGVGGIIAGLVLPGVVGTSGWRAGFQVVGCLAIGLTLGCGLLLIRSHPTDVGLLAHGAHDLVEEERAEASGLPASTAWRTPQLVALLVGLTGLSGIMSLQQHFASMMADRDLDLAASGTLITVLSMVNVGATLLLGSLADRWGPSAAYLLSGGLLLAALSLFLLTSGYPFQATAVLLFSIPTITPPIMTPILLRAAFGGRAFATLLGAATATMPVGIAIGSPLWGLAKDATGDYTSALLVALGIALVAVPLVTWSVRSGRKLWRPPPSGEPERLQGRPSQA